MHRMTRWAIVVLLGFCAGALCDAWLAVRLARAQRATRVEAPIDPRSQDSSPAASDARPLPPVADAPHPTASAPLGTSGGAPGGAPIATLREHALRLPVDSVDVEGLKGSFEEIHSGHRHEAVDILAPRGTPVRAADAGTIAKLFTSKGGGISVYQFDPSRQFVYYYAHLDAYAPGLQEGQPVEAGQVLGYVGTTGNAPPNTPHLHFAISQLAPGEGWWQGTPVDPYLVFAR